MEKSFWTEIQNELNGFLYDFGPNLIYAVVALIIGIIVIKILMRILNRIMNKANTELSLRSFINSMSLALLYFILAYVVGRTLGIKASAFIAIFGAAGLAIGLALQGSLANFAGGLLILIFKPFKIGDEVVLKGVQGEVLDINILYTKLHDWRGQHYTMPNGQVANSVMTNNSAEEYRRVQVELHFSLDEDIDQLREIITTAMKKNPDAIQDKPFQFWVNNFQDYYVKTSARCWAKSSEYWGVYWAQEEAIKKALAEHGIKLQIPKQTIEQPDLQEKKSK